jgi:hypothetical protein
MQHVWPHGGADIWLLSYVVSSKKTQIPTNTDHCAAAFARRSFATFAACGGNLARVLNGTKIVSGIGHSKWYIASSQLWRQIILNESPE